MHISRVTIIITEFYFQIKLFTEEIKIIQNQNAYYIINGELSSSSSVFRNFHWQNPLFIPKLC